MHRLLIGLLALFMAGNTVRGATGIVVLGLFKDKAVVSIDGQQRVLGVGQTSPEGVTLIAASSREAVLERDGQRLTLALGSHIATTFAHPRETSVQLWADPKGMYRASGSINGFPVTLLVDTGASAVAMNATEARRLGLQYRLNGEPGTVATASGVERGYGVVLNKVAVGDIVLRDVEAVVLDGAHPSEVLLGMSFLGRLQMERDGASLRLKLRQ